MRTSERQFKEFESQLGAMQAAQARNFASQGWAGWFDFQNAGVLGFSVYGFFKVCWDVVKMIA